MQIVENRAVAISYELMIDDGIVVDTAEKDSPLWFIAGRKQLLPKFEKALLGLKSGDRTTVTLAPQDGYGVHSGDLVADVPKSQIRNKDGLLPGSEITLAAKDGKPLYGVIVGVKKDHVTVDFNHQLAGKTLTFNVAIENVRSATKEELAHGHVHGEGEHHH